MYQLLTKSKTSDLDKLQKSLETAQKEENKLSLRIGELEENLEDIRANYDQEKTEKEKLKADCGNKDSQVGKLKSSLEDKTKQISHLESLVIDKDGEKERFNKEREDLLSKIQAGEGVNEAIQQLNGLENLVNCIYFKTIIIILAINRLTELEPLRCCIRPLIDTSCTISIITVIWCTNSNSKAVLRYRN